MSDSEFAEPDGFFDVDIRVGRVVSAEPLQGARRPAYAMTINFGDEIGIKQSSAQITEAYNPEDLVGRLVMGVVNFPPRRVAGYRSEVLTLGIYSDGGNGPVILISPDAHPAAKVGDKLG